MFRRNITGYTGDRSQTMLLILNMYVNAMEKRKDNTNSPEPKINSVMPNLVRISEPFTFPVIKVFPHRPQ